MSDGLDAARAALQARQGGGARYDAEAAPHGDLLLARRGTAYFARKLNALRDADLDALSLRAGWNRRQLIAHVGYHARACARLADAAAQGRTVPMYPSDAARRAEIALGATLPARALRHLVDHAAVHLNVAWRDLPDAAWEAPVILQDGNRAAARDLPRIRARVVWHAATALGNGGRIGDIPVELREAPAAD